MTRVVLDTSALLALCFAEAGADVTIARGQESDTLDPHKSALLVAHEVMWQIYDSLVYLDEAGTLYPGLALSWAFSNENKTVTFKLICWNAANVSTQRAAGVVVGTCP